MSSTYDPSWIQARDSGPRTLYERKRTAAPPRRATNAAFFAGFLVAWTPILAPIHEIGHVLMGWLDPGIAVKMMGWRDTWYVGDASVPFLLAGFAFAGAVYTVAAVSLAKRGKIVAASFFAGNILTQPLYAGMSSDIYKMEVLHGAAARQASMVALWIAMIWGLLFALAHIQHYREKAGGGEKLANRVNMVADPPGRRR